MVTLLGVVGAVVVLFAAAALATRPDEVLREAPPDRADVGLPDRPLAAGDLTRLRFGMVVRGYRMSEVDSVLDRVETDLATGEERRRHLDHELERAVDALRTSQGRVAELEAELAAELQRRGTRPAP